MPGRLVVCPTPIGNLDDVTVRVREALVSSDYIACEDTRRTGSLLDKLGIRPHPRLISNHEGNETARATELAQRIERGENVALVSDAGMPAISDPGYKLIHRCIERDLEVTVLPGPSVVPWRWSPPAADRPLALRGLPAAPRRRDGAGDSSCRRRRSRPTAGCRSARARRALAAIRAGVRELSNATIVSAERVIRSILQARRGRKPSKRQRLVGQPGGDQSHRTRPRAPAGPSPSRSRWLQRVIR